MAQHFDLEEQEQIDRIKHFWNTWGNLITGVLIVVFGAWAAYNGYQYWRNHQSLQAAGLLDAMVVALDKRENDQANQSFEALREKYPKTQQAAYAGLLQARARFEQGEVDNARAALQWVRDHAGDEGLKSVAALRLAALQLDANQPKEAEAALASNVATPFAALASDRKGDALQAQSQSAAAAQAYESAYKALPAESNYRQMVEVKMQALGVQPDAATP